MKNIRNTVKENGIVCFTAFALSCAAFMFSVLVIIPLVSVVAEKVEVSEFVQMAAILAALFVVPVMAALGGVNIGVKMINYQEDNA